MNVHRRVDADRETVRETQLDPVAGIWLCDNCGRRIQVVAEGNLPKVQPFVCVCGNEMTPGDEHGQVDKDLQSEVIDD